MGKLNIVGVILFVVLLSGCGYQIRVKAYANKGKETTVATYDTGTKELVLLDFNKYKRTILKFYRQLFPDKKIDPAIQQSKIFNPREFERMCKFAKIKECK